MCATDLAVFLASRVLARAKGVADRAQLLFSPHGFGLEVARDGLEAVQHLERGRGLEGDFAPDDVDTVLARRRHETIDRRPPTTDRGRRRPTTTDKDDDSGR